MEWNLVNTLAFIVAVATLLKLVFIHLIPKPFMKFAEKWVKCKSIKWLYGILAAVLGYFLIMELGAPTVAACAMLGVAMLGVFLVSYPKTMQVFLKDFMKDTHSAWLAWLLWVVLAVWTLYALFA